MDMIRMNKNQQEQQFYNVQISQSSGVSQNIWETFQDNVKGVFCTACSRQERLDPRLTVKGNVCKMFKICHHLEELQKFLVKLFCCLL